MFAKLEIFQMAQAMAGHAAARQSVLARNIANADTPGYRAQDIASFSETYRSAEDGFALRTTRAAHLNGSEHRAVARTRPATDTPLSPNGNNVSLETEMAKSVATKSDHDLALSVYKNALTVLRLSLGRQ